MEVDNQKKGTIIRYIKNYIKKGVYNKQKLQNLFLEAKFYGIDKDFGELFKDVDLSGPPKKSNNKGFKQKLSQNGHRKIGQLETESAFSGKGWKPKSLPGDKWNLPNPL